MNLAPPGPSGFLKPEKNIGLQPGLFPREMPSVPAFRSNGRANRLDVRDRHFHDWYRFVLSFPAHLVRDYIRGFALGKGDILLDPFCGTGTTLVEAKLRDISSIGIEANTMAHFACSVKVNWSVNPDDLLHHATQIAKKTEKAIGSEIAPCPLEEEQFALLLKDSISPEPLRKSLILLEQIKGARDSSCKQHELLAFAKSLVYSNSNLHFGPEVGVRRIKKHDAQVVENWLVEIRKMANDLRRTYRDDMNDASCVVHHADARQVANLLKPQSVSAVFTSPPYPNEKDYTRTTRLESVLLGFVRNKEDLRKLKKDLLCSNTRNAYKCNDDDKWVADHAEIQSLAEKIEKRRISLGKTSGFERQYGRVTKLYFGGMARHLAELRTFLKPGAYLGYVVGDQASYLQVMIRTGQLLAEIAQSLGYRVVGIDLFRTRLAAATRQRIREEVVVLQWPKQTMDAV